MIGAAHRSREIRTIRHGSIFQAAIALHMAYYNLCKVHCAIRATPAMEVGVENSIVSVAELLERCGE